MWMVSAKELDTSFLVLFGGFTWIELIFYPIIYFNNKNMSIKQMCEYLNVID